MSECTKHPYPTWHAAYRALRWILDHPNPVRPPKVRYVTPCHVEGCDAYHLSSGRGRPPSKVLASSLWSLRRSVDARRLR